MLTGMKNKARSWKEIKGQEIIRKHIHTEKTCYNVYR